MVLDHILKINNPQDFWKILNKQFAGTLHPHSLHGAPIPTRNISSTDRDQCFVPRSIPCNGGWLNPLQYLVMQLAP